MNPWLILPYKSIAHGKSRLASVLDLQQRRELNVYLLERALSLAADFAGSQRTLVVSHCPEVAAMARRHGCCALDETQSAGLSLAVEGAIVEARRRGAGELLVMSCDLPFACQADLEAIVQSGRGHGAVVIATDRHAIGTNALYLPAQASIPLQYGPDSCALHFAAARERQLPARVVLRDGLAFDIDSPGDLEAWRRAEPAPA